MKIIVCILLIFNLTSCKFQSSAMDIECNENAKFKREFFDCIENIEAYNLKIKNSKGELVSLTQFNECLEKLSYYVKIDYTLIANYEIGYPSKEVFDKEKKGWELWYQQNKCKNLQWKQ